MISVEQAITFDRDGFLLIDELFSAEEVAVLLAAVDEATHKPAEPPPVEERQPPG